MIDEMKIRFVNGYDGKNDIVKENVQIHYHEL